MIQSLENIKKSVSEFPSLLCDLKEYLDNRCTHFRAGCITESISNLQMITSDKEILTSVRGATIEFDTQPYHTKRPQSTFSAEERVIIDSEVAKLMRGDLRQYSVSNSIITKLQFPVPPSEPKLDQQNRNWEVGTEIELTEQKLRS